MNNETRFYITKCIVVRKDGRFGDVAMMNGIFSDDAEGVKKAEAYRKQLQETNDTENGVKAKTTRRK